ncbi:MobA/MobL family protein [Herbaspirillum camelliae]|uniref:MobA/MobL family protein n=1 Tax=Herbaspirillum camelliae TaxID=1892903 RepID=UPI000949E9E6|nr:MobA/MobL family protein [Herbaspirillum camelliae]
MSPLGHYHFRVSVGDRKGGGRIDAHLKYQYNFRTGRYQDLNRQRNARAGNDETLLYSQSGNLPLWASDNAESFWRASHEFERKNGTQYREFEASLPRGLSLQEQIGLVQSFVSAHFSRHPFSLAVHSKRQSDGMPAAHVHIQISERLNDGIDRSPDRFFKRYNAKDPAGGGCKKDSMGTRDRLQAFRQSWAEHCNTSLEAVGRLERVDHRSYKDRQIDLQPEKKMAGKKARTLTEMDSIRINESRSARRSYIEALMRTQNLRKELTMYGTLKNIAAHSNTAKHSSAHFSRPAPSNPNNVFYINKLREDAAVLEKDLNSFLRNPSKQEAKLLSDRLIELAQKTEIDRKEERTRTNSADVSASHEIVSELLEAIRRGLNFILRIFGIEEIPPFFPSATKSLQHAGDPPASARSALGSTVAALRRQELLLDKSPIVSRSEIRTSLLEKMITSSDAAPEFKKLRAQQTALARAAGEQREIQTKLRDQLTNSTFIARNRLTKQMADLDIKIINTDRKATGVDNALDRLLQKFEEEHKEAIDMRTNSVLEIQREQQEFRQRLRRAIEEAGQQDKLDTGMKPSSEPELGLTTRNGLEKEVSTRAGFNPKMN